MLTYLDQFDEISHFVPISDTELKIKNNYISKYNLSNKFLINDKEAEKHINFIQWLKNIICADIRKTRLIIYDFEYRGLLTTTDIEEREIILKIPFKNTISIDNIDGEWKKIIDKIPLGNHLLRYIYPALFIMEELKKAPNSKIQPYLDVLPKNFENFPVFFNEEDYKFLTGSFIEEYCKNDLKIIEIYINAIRTGWPEFFEKHTIENFLHYYYTLNSRYFGILHDGHHMTALIPYADMPNNTNFKNSNATWDYDYLTHEFQFIATKNINKSEPVFFINIF